MTDIEIVFLRDNPTPIVTREHQAALVGQRVTWEITSYDPKIEKVRIEFSNSGMNIFSPKTPSHVIEEPLHLYGDIRRREIYGKAPAMEVGDGACGSFKYTVFGLDAGGQTVAAKDPDIVIAKP